MPNSTPSTPSIPSKKNKFTPGPWYIKQREVIRCKYSRDSYTRTTILDTPKGQYKRRHVIATVARGNGREDANAAMIAAAPEMYEMLNMIYEHKIDFRRCAYCHESSEKCPIKELLKKARGEK